MHYDLNFDDSYDELARMINLNIFSEITRELIRLCQVRDFDCPANYPVGYLDPFDCLLEVVMPVICPLFAGEFQIYIRHYYD